MRERAVNAASEDRKVCSFKGRCGRSLQRHLVYCHFLIKIYFKTRLSTNNGVCMM